MRDPDRRELIRHLMLEMTDPLPPTEPDAGTELSVVVAAAVLAASSDELLVDARRLATSTPDRQFVAIAAAFLVGDHDRVDVLARDHLLDHPTRPVLTWIVAHSRAAATHQQRRAR